MVLFAFPITCDVDMMRDLGDPNPPCSFVSSVVNVFNHPMKKRRLQKTSFGAAEGMGLILGGYCTISISDQSKFVGLSMESGLAFTAAGRDEAVSLTSFTLSNDAAAAKTAFG